MKYKFLNFTNLMVFLALFVLWWITHQLISPFLHYQLQQPAFLKGASFFMGFSNYPGGISDYFGEFIAQFFRFNRFGALLIVAIAALQGLLAFDMIRRLIGSTKLRYSIIALVSLFGVVVLCNYYYPYYASIRLLFAFIFSWGFLIVNQKKLKFALIYWIILDILLFYMAGGFAMFIFTLSSVFILIKTNRRKIHLLYVPLFVVFSALLPYLGYKLVFQMSLANLYQITLFKPPAMLAYTPGFPIYIYYFLLPAFLFAALIFDKPGESSKKTTGNAAKKQHKSNLFQHSSILVLAQVIVVGGLGYFLFVKFHDPVKKNLLRIEYYAEQEQWNKVLSVAQKFDKFDFRVNFQINRAYLQIGELPERLFDYPQLLGTLGLFIDTKLVNSVSMATSDLYFDLGFMDESQHWAYEAQTLLPNSPRILKRLIMINLVKGNYPLANKFLDILDKNMLYNDWVGKYQAYITDTSLVAKDKLLMEKRLFNPHKNAMNIGNEENLKLLFEHNRNNRKAFDYLLSYLILDTQLNDFAGYLQHYKLYNLKSLPRSWEEALTIYMARTSKVPENVPGDIVSKNCIKRFNDFTDRIVPYKNNLQEARSAVHHDYEHTFWYYLLYLNPKVTKVLESKSPVQ